MPEITPPRVCFAGTFVRDRHLMYDQARELGWEVVQLVREDPDVVVMGNATTAPPFGIRTTAWSARKAGIPVITEGEWADIAFTGEIPLLPL